MHSSLIERLLHYAEATPTHDAVVSPSVSLSYAQLANLVRQQAKYFDALGVSNTAVIGIQCANDIQHLICCLAATHLGATSCTVPNHESAAAQTSLSERCQVTHFISADSLVPIAASSTPTTHQIDAPITSPPAASARLLFSTSGTTGEPKLVVLQDGDLVAQAHRHISSTQERFACIASMEHNFAKRHRLYVVASGATNVFFDPGAESLVNQSLSMAANVIHVSGFQAQEMLAEPGIEQLAPIRLKLGGAHVPSSLRQQLKRAISEHLQAGYGTTETGAIAFTDPMDSSAGESVGQPLPGIEVRVVCPNRKPLRTGERGELAIRCQGMFREYLGQPELTATRLEDGWFYTGDIGYLDKQQRIYLCGRSDDMFVFNSMNIYPQDLESTIRQHPNIDEVAVIPKASSAHGNIPVALLVFKQGVKQHLPDIQKYAKKHLGLRRPRHYLIVPELPKTTSGKLARTTALHLPKKSSETRSAILTMLNPNILEQLSPSVRRAFVEGEQEIKLHHMGMDSLARMDFLVSLELAFDAVITPQELRAFRYLGNVAAHILSPPTSVAKHAAPSSKPEPVSTDTKPYAVRFFQRLLSLSQTVAELNRAITTLEQRLTPLEMEHLQQGHRHGQLVPSSAAEKFHVAVEHWLQGAKTLMNHSGKASPEPFSSRKLSPTARLFSGPTSPKGKTLLICFPPRDMRQMGIPNTLLLQHVNAKKYDLLMISTQFQTGYRRGKSNFQASLAAFTHWLNSEPWLAQYQRFRTLGFSAGGRTAIATAHLLDAEMAVSVSGRFHRKQHILKNLDQIIAMYRTVRQRRCPQVILSYVPDNLRDPIFAKFIARFFGGTKMEIRHEQAKLKHLIFQQLLEQGELATFLASSIFSEQKAEALGPANGSTPSQRRDFAILLPSGKTQPLDIPPISGASKAMRPIG